MPSADSQHKVSQAVNDSPLYLLALFLSLGVNRVARFHVLFPTEPKDLAEVSLL